MLVCRALYFSNLPRDVRCNWYHRAQLSITESRKSHARHGLQLCRNGDVAPIAGSLESYWFF